MTVERLAELLDEHTEDGLDELLNLLLHLSSQMMANNAQDDTKLIPGPVVRQVAMTTLKLSEEYNRGD